MGSNLFIEHLPLPKETIMKELVMLFRTLYLISRNSEKHEIVIDEETLKFILDELEKLSEY